MNSDHPIYTLVYTSSATQPFDDEALTALLRNARAVNETHGITGLLAYYDGCFVQLIEGPEAEVRQLYENLSRDPRHKIFGHVDEGHLPARSFPDWTMAFRHFNRRKAEKLSGERDSAAALRAAIDIPNDAATGIFFKSCLSALLPNHLVD